MLRARSLLSRVLLCIWLDGSIPSMGHPAFPFIGQGKARVTVEEKEKNERERKASRITGSFFTFMWVPPTL